MTESNTILARRKPLSWIAMTLIFTNIGLGSLVALALYSFGSLGPALGYLRGDRLIPDAYAKSFGTVEQGEVRTINFQLKNMSNQPIRILGGRPSCSCLVVDQLPMTLPLNGECRIRVGVRSSLRSGRIAESIRLFTDLPSQSSLELKVVGRVLGTETKARGEDTSGRVR
jgi:hypothetical protein